MNQWIKSTDLLPTDDGKYLAYFPDDARLVGRIEILTWRTSVKDWDGSRHTSALWEGFKPTHWMALPELPQEAK